MNNERRQFFLKTVVSGFSLGSLTYYPQLSWAQASDQTMNTTPPPEKFKDTQIQDPSTGRIIGIRIRLPEKKEATGLIIYSPGLGSGFSNGAHWCDSWQKAGFTVVTLSHPVTNDSIWDTSKANFKTNLQAALASPQYGLRVNDCKFAITSCLKSLGIESYIDPKRIGIAGHSFGALTVQSISGQLGSKDARIKAAIALSPGALPKDRAKTMNQVRIPFMCITGQHDSHVTFTYEGQSMKLGVPLENRLAIFEHLPKGHKYLLNLNQADHMSFAGEEMDPKKFSRNIQATKESELKTWQKVSSVSTLFWKEHLKVNKDTKDVKIDKDAIKKQMRSVLDTNDILDIA